MLQEVIVNGDKTNIQILQTIKRDLIDTDVWVTFSGSAFEYLRSI